MCRSSKSVARVDEAAKRRFKEQFQLDVFEKPYVDAARASSNIGREKHREVALEVQRKSIVLRQNQDRPAGGKTLPPTPIRSRPAWTMA